MKNKTHPKGYIMVVALLALVVFSLTSFALFNSHLQDTRHQIRVLRFDENYFLSQGAMECARHYFIYQAPHLYDGVGSNDSSKTITINIEGISMTVAIEDTQG